MKHYETEPGVTLAAQELLKTEDVNIIINIEVPGDEILKIPAGLAQGDYTLGDMQDHAEQTIRDALYYIAKERPDLHKHWEKNGVKVDFCWLVKDGLEEILKGQTKH